MNSLYSMNNFVAFLDSDLLYLKDDNLEELSKIVVYSDHAELYFVDSKYIQNMICCSYVAINISITDTHGFPKYMVRLEGFTKNISSTYRNEQPLYTFDYESKYTFKVTMQLCNISILNVINEKDRENKYIHEYSLTVSK